MDPLSGLLDHPRARGVFTLRVVMGPPWSIDVRDEAALTLVVVLEGSARLRADGRVTNLRRGDVALVRGPEPYVVEHLDPGLGGERVTAAVIGPDQTCSTPDGTDLHLALTRGTRTWGNTPAGVSGTDSLLVATYAGTGEVGRLVMDALPRVAHVPAARGSGAAPARRATSATRASGAGLTETGPSTPGSPVARSTEAEPSETGSPLVDLLAREVTSDGPGQGTVLDRLVDALLVITVRAWLAAHPDEAPGWLDATHDPVVDTALRALHDRPAQTWTVESLAHEANVSRATLAARFRTHVGSPPMAYLTRWRLTLAADLLTTTDRTLASIASDVGYGSPFALSAAFSQQMGASPSAYRRRHQEPS